MATNQDVLHDQSRRYHDSHRRLPGRRAAPERQPSPEPPVIPIFRFMGATTRAHELEQRFRVRLSEHVAFTEPSTSALSTPAPSTSVATEQPNQPGLSDPVKNATRDRHRDHVWFTMEPLLELSVSIEQQAIRSQQHWAYDFQFEQLNYVPEPNPPEPLEITPEVASQLDNIQGKRRRKGKSRGKEKEKLRAGASSSTNSRGQSFTVPVNVKSLHGPSHSHSPRPLAKRRDSGIEPKPLYKPSPLSMPMNSPQDRLDSYSDSHSDGLESEATAIDFDNHTGVWSASSSLSTVENAENETVLPPSNRRSYDNSCSHIGKEKGKELGKGKEKADPTPGYRVLKFPPPHPGTFPSYTYGYTHRLPLPSTSVEVASSTLPLPHPYTTHSPPSFMPRTAEAAVATLLKPATWTVSSSSTR